MAHPLKIIAHRMGFTQSSAFCYWFKKSVGLTPSEYRMRNVGCLPTGGSGGGGACFANISEGATALVQ
jgi:AraC-like DNA-binding protein